MTYENTKTRKSYVERKKCLEEAELRKPLFY